MAWIESHQTLGGHPKTRKLAHLLGISKPQAIGHLHCLWWWAMDYAEDGDLSRHDALDIAIGAEWEGDAGEFVDALLAVGFLEENDDHGTSIHDWHDYAGKLIERRKLNAKRMRDARAEHEKPTEPAQNNTSNERAAHVQRTQRARVELPNQTQPNQTQPNHTNQTVPNQNTTSAEPSNVSRLDRDFEEFWKTYPTGRGVKKKARENWMKLKPSSELVDEIMRGLERWLLSEQWQGGYIKYAETFVKDRMWENPAPPPQKRNGQGPKSNGGWSRDDYAAYAVELERQGR